jgi:uncharacterized Zn finger protein (UPF0148 family)
MIETICRKCRKALKKGAVVCAVCGALVAGTAQPGAAPTFALHSGQAAVYALTADRPDAPHDPIPDTAGPPSAVDASTTVATTRVVGVPLPCRPGMRNHAAYSRR